MGYLLQWAVIRHRGSPSSTSAMFSRDSGGVMDNHGDARSNNDVAVGGV